MLPVKPLGSLCEQELQVLALKHMSNISTSNMQLSGFLHKQQGYLLFGPSPTAAVSSRTDTLGRQSYLYKNM